jgi:hypothetical protein
VKRKADDRGAIRPRSFDHSPEERGRTLSRGGYNGSHPVAAPLLAPNPAKPEPRTSPGNPNLETRNPKQLMKNQNSRKRKQAF